MDIIRELGLIQVYTGNGKGKTTAALGLALRAVGHGFRVHMIQFTKGGGYSGELISAEKLSPLFTISQFGRGCPMSSLIRKGYEKCNGCGNCFLKDRGPNSDDIETARKAINQAWEFIRNQECDILILDEIGNALKYNLVSLEQILEIMKEKPAEMELILTGRDMPEEVITQADLATEMKEIKHPYQKGVSSRRGIEY